MRFKTMNLLNVNCTQVTNANGDIEDPTKCAEGAGGIELDGNTCLVIKRKLPLFY